MSNVFNIESVVNLTLPKIVYHEDNNSAGCVTTEHINTNGVSLEDTPLVVQKVLLGAMRVGGTSA